MATDGVKKSGGKIWGKRSKAWQLWRVRADGSQIQLVAEGVTRAELNRLHKRRLDWLCTRSITTISPSASAISCDGEEQEEAMTDRIQIIRHEVVPKRGSYEVRFSDGRPSKYFYYEDIPGRRLRSDQADSFQALKDAKAFARAERDRA